MSQYISSESLNKRAAKIKLLVLDVDGVLTDGKLYFGDGGQEMKAFSTLDGHGIKLLRSTGVEVGIITGRKSVLVEKRAADLSIRLLYQGREDKFTALTEMLVDFPCALNEVAYVGDDHPDLLVMTQIDLAIASANAHEDVLRYAHYKTSKPGGEGAVREVCDLIMRAQGTYDQILAKYVEK